MSGQNDGLENTSCFCVQSGPLSRRSFIKGVVAWTACSVCVAGAPFAPALQERGGPGLQAAFAAFQGVVPLRAAGHIARVSSEVSTCASCGLCTMVCATVHGGEANPSLAGIWLHRKPFACVYDSIVCKQCNSPECYEACHIDGGGAMYIHPAIGARAIDPSKCLGCRACMEACVFSPPRISFDAASNTAFKCDLCSERPEGPACVEFCPHQALIFIREPSS